LGIATTIGERASCGPVAAKPSLSASASRSHTVEDGTQPSYFLTA
jgi:hypothetical protein